MRLISVDLENIGVHRKLHLDFGDGLIALFGPQGSGKTTIVNSVYAAITNDFSRLADGKLEAASQQAKGEPASIEARIECGGTKLRIRRQIAPTSRSKLEIAKGDIFTKETEIRGAMSSILDASRALLDNYVFVDQWAVRNLFQSTASQRAEVLSHLCGTRFIGACYDAANQMRQSDFALLSEGTENTDRLRKELTEYNALMYKELAWISEIEKVLLTTEEEARHKLVVSNFTEMLDIDKKMPGLLRKLEEASNLKTATDESEAELRSKIPLLEVKEMALRQELEAARKEQAVYDSVASSWKMKQKLTKELLEKELQLENLQKPSEDLQGSAKYFDDKISNITAEMAPHTMLLGQYERLPHADTCPLCHGDITDIAGRLDSARDIIKVQAAAINTIKEQRQSYFDQVKEIDAYKILKSNIEKSIDEAKSNLAVLKEIEEPAAPSVSITKISSLHQEAGRNLNELRTEHEEEIRWKEKRASAYEVLEKEVLEADARLQLIAAPQKSFNDSERALREDSDRRFNKAGSEAKCEEYERVIKSREVAIKEAEEKLARTKKIKDWVALLGRILPVLHRDGLAREVHSRAMRRLEGTINSTLSEFESPFRISTGEDLSYTAKFPNGTEVPAHRLSGGQQVVLSLAMRWALNSLFANQIGLLVLDEPTAGLDERHLGLLESTLSKLGAAARNRGCQVIIITHERRLGGVFDQIIELERPVL